jgi:acetylornithine deacetylase
VKLLAAIAELEREWGNRKAHPLMPLGITTINPGMIAGGTGVRPDGMPASFRSYSNMADHCVIGLSLKYLPDEDGEAVRREFEAFVARFAATDPWLRDHPPVIEWDVAGLHFPPCDIPRDHPLCIAAADATKAVTGATTWRGSEGVTDLAFLAAAGIPGIVYGPGSVERSHGTNEYLDVEQLYVAMEVIALTVADFCGVS